MKQGYWVVRTYEAGIIGEKTKFWVPGEKPTGKSRKKEKSEIKKQEQNEWSSVKRVARLMHANFRKKDILLGLDYSPAGLAKVYEKAREKYPNFDAATEGERLDMIWEAADHEMKLCIRRVQRAMKKDGLELKYIAVTSDMDGDTGEQVPVHHHLVVPAGAEKYFREKWTLGERVDYEKISKQADYTPIAEYLLKQVRRIPDGKKYNPSRNLIRPQPKDRAVLSDAELRVPKGGKLLFRQEYKTNTGKNGETFIRPQYIRYILPPDRRKKEGSAA